VDRPVVSGGRDDIEIGVGGFGIRCISVLGYHIGIVCVDVKWGWAIICRNIVETTTEAGKLFDTRFGFEHW